MDYIATLDQLLNVSDAITDNANKNSKANQLLEEFI